MLIPERHEDDRGWFAETFRLDRFEAEAGNVTFVQHSRSLSQQRGTVRGLHFQVEPAAQGKLVKVSRGRIFDVAVDLRSSSPTYGGHVAVDLSADNGRQLWIPAGFAHGFCTLEDDCEVAYMLTDYYSVQHERGLRWDDPALAIRWPVDTDRATLSARDKQQPSLAQLRAVFT
ncbi:dTDP-4-dehydrorhamnose 3,5-epimerase [Pseudolabrys sp. FHR47]|uniref:dTDP-4-dehydrorhamnose 3,5-epimerase n=1 Tax=Pseudolabrys sp. FHR47 TaxID=2562284 RepID=UPI0010BEB49A|nr:dTDP-4-dehydrorhamnose 3,5-epimerase [Pseudolabrys sp. FHR47]